MIYVKKSRQHQKGCRIVTICYRVHLLSATVKEGGISHQFNEKICSDRVGLYFLLQGRRKRRQPSIQQRDLLSSGRVHLLAATVKEAASAMGLPNGMFPGTQLYGET